jgi:hypothetical protein
MFRLAFLFPTILICDLSLCANNLDEENDRQVETFDALNWTCSENLGGCFVETSAKNNLGVKDAFSLLLEQWSYLFYLFPKIFNLQE